MAIKALLFDNYGVLMDPIFDSFREMLPPELSQEIAKASKRSDSGKISSLKRERLVADTLDQAGYDGMAEIGRAIERSHKNGRLLQFIENSRDRYKTGLVSNASANIKSLYGRGELRRYFDVVVLSYQVGVIKPEPRIYQIAVERLGVLPDECVFTDDNPANIAGAVACGMYGIVYTDFDTYIAELRKYTDA